MILQRFRLRLAQVITYVRPGSVDITPWRAHLVPDALATFVRLPEGDQRHAVSVARSLQERGSSFDLVSAGLLHDIGKAVPGISVHLADRVGKVLLAGFIPRKLSNLASLPSPPPLLNGVWVLSRHARHGAQLVRQWGYPERVAWLIEHHEDRQVTDRELALLIAVDDGRAGKAADAGRNHD